jgi:membrane protease YdiL (CAAX protease family)
LPSRQHLLRSTLVSLALQFYVSLVVARDVGYEIFGVPALGVREVLAGLTALALCFSLIPVNRAIRSAAERRAMPVYKLIPRTAAEWSLYVPVALAAGVAEEAAYRGVAIKILWYGLGNPWAAVLISATAFAVSHAVQGWKSGIVIFVIALAMHTLVWFTGTLVVAMVVHSAYDLAAGYLAARRVARGEVDG